MDIEQEILSWNKKTSDSIADIHIQHCHEPYFIIEVIRLMQKPALQKGATRLLKKHLDTGGTIEANEVDAIYGMLPTFEHWESKLHILQCIPFMPISTKSKNSVEIFLRQCLMEMNKFVRTWAYNGFYEMSLKHPEYQGETRQFF